MTANRLVDFDWTVSDIVSSSMCDDHSVFVKDQQETTTITATSSSSTAADGTATSSAAAGGADSSAAAALNSSASEPADTKPMASVLRLELLVNEFNERDQTRQMKPHLLELAAPEIDNLIKTLQAALAAES